MTRTRLTIIATLLLVIAMPAFATNGYFSHGQGTTNKALGGAGIAEPQDALAGEVNPASLSLLDREFFISTAIFNPNRSYTINGQPTGHPGTFGLSRGTVESDNDFFFMPSLAAVFPVSEKNTLGFSIVAHGGMNTSYPVQTFYGATPTGVDLMQGFVNGTWSYKIAPKHSLGLSAVVAYQRFEANGLEAFGQMSSDPTRLTGNSYDDSWGLGFKIGYIGQIHPKLSIAAAYSPKINMSEFDSYAGLFCESGDFDIPTNYTVGLSYKPTQRIKLLADYEKIEYSGVNSIGHKMFPNLMEKPLGMHGSAGFGWQDVTVYKFGFQFDQNDDWTWRLGYSNGDQPIPSSEVMFNILAPGVIEEHITGGFSKSFGPNQFHMSLMYALENTVVGQNPMEAPGAQTIELTMDEWELEFGYSYRF
jgi:long-chain fatty acid transport protein